MYTKIIKVSRCVASVDSIRILELTNLDPDSPQQHVTLSNTLMGGQGKGGGGGVPKHEQHNLLLIEASQNRDGE